MTGAIRRAGARALGLSALILLALATPPGVHGATAAMTADRSSVADADRLAELAPDLLAMPETFADAAGWTLDAGSAVGSVDSAVLTAGNAAAWRVTAGLATWRDARYSAQTKIVSAAAEYRVLKFADNGNFVFARVDARGTFDLWKVVASVSTQVAAVAQPVSPDEWYWIELGSMGPTYTAKLYASGASPVAKDGAKLLRTITATIPDPAVAAGRIGLQSDAARPSQWGGVAAAPGGAYVEIPRPAAWAGNIVHRGTLGGQAIAFDSGDAGPFGQPTLQLSIPAPSRGIEVTYPYLDRSGAPAALAPGAPYTVYLYEKVSGLGGSGPLLWAAVRELDQNEGHLAWDALADAGETSFTRKITTFTTNANARRSTVHLNANYRSDTGTTLGAIGTLLVSLARIEQGRILLINGGLDDWSRGPDADPDGWARVGGAGRVERVEAARRPGGYAARYTRADTNVNAFQDLFGYQGAKAVTCSASVVADKAQVARLVLDDGTDPAYSPWNGAAGAPEELNVTHPIGPATTKLRVLLDVSGAALRLIVPGTIAAFEGVRCYATAPSFADQAGRWAAENHIADRILDLLILLTVGLGTLAWYRLRLGPLAMRRLRRAGEWPWREWRIPGLIAVGTLVALLLRLNGIDSADEMVDELRFSYIKTGGLHDVIDYLSIVADQESYSIGQPFLSALAVQFFGTHLFAIRLPSAILSAGTTAVIALTVWTLVPGRWPIIAVTMLATALALNAIALSQQAIPYAALEFFAALLLYVFYCVVRARYGLREWLVFFVVLYIASTFNFAVMFAAAALMLFAAVDILWFGTAGTSARAKLSAVRAAGMATAIFVFMNIQNAYLFLSSSRKPDPTVGIHDYHREYYFDSLPPPGPLPLPVRIYDVFAQALNYVFDPRVYRPGWIDPLSAVLVGLIIVGLALAIRRRTETDFRRFGILLACVIGLSVFLNYLRIIPLGATRHDTFWNPFIYVSLAYSLSAIGTVVGAVRSRAVLAVAALAMIVPFAYSWNAVYVGRMRDYPTEVAHIVGYARQYDAHVVILLDNETYLRRPVYSWAYPGVEYGPLPFQLVFIDPPALPHGLSSLDDDPRVRTWAPNGRFLVISTMTSYDGRFAHQEKIRKASVYPTLQKLLQDGGVPYHVEALEERDIDFSMVKYGIQSMYFPSNELNVYLLDRSRVDGVTPVR